MEKRYEGLGHFHYLYLPFSLLGYRESNQQGEGRNTGASRIAGGTTGRCSRETGRIGRTTLGHYPAPYLPYKTLRNNRRTSSVVAP